MDRLLSRGLANFVGPGVDDRISVEIAEVGKDTASEFGLGIDPNVTQQRARHFGKEALHEIEPGAVVPRYFDAHDADATTPWHLVLEDLTDTHALATEWPLPPSEARCRAIMGSLGRFHAAWWED